MVYTLVYTLLFTLPPERIEATFAALPKAATRRYASDFPIRFRIPPGPGLAPAACRHGRKSGE